VRISYLYLETIAKNGSWESLTQRELSQLTMPVINTTSYGTGSMKTNLIGVAAQAHKLNKFPKHLFSQEGLIAANEEKETALHFICHRKQIEHVPTNLLREKDLLQPNKDGSTPLHYLAFHGELHKLEKKFLQSKNLEKPNRYDLTCLDFALAARYGFSAGLIPSNHNQKKGERDPIKEVLKRLSEEFLKSQLNLPKESKLYKEKTRAIHLELTKRKVMKDTEQEKLEGRGIVL
jgi:hypothetical protein